MGRGTFNQHLLLGLQGVYSDVGIDTAGGNTFAVGGPGHSIDTSCQLNGSGYLLNMDMSRYESL